MHDVGHKSTLSAQREFIIVRSRIIEILLYLKDKNTLYLFLILIFLMETVLNFFPVNQSIDIFSVY